ncbi:MAG: hypothetical protein ACOC33_02535 [bacterium]
MIEIKNIEVYGYHRIVKAVRRSFNSQDKSDSIGSPDNPKTYQIGPKDAKLLSSLIKNGDSHAKIMRMIWVWVDISAPRRFWVDFDTYKLGRIDIDPSDIEMFSDSTMHTINKRLLEQRDFAKYTEPSIINIVNDKIKSYRENPSNEALIKIKDNLPEGFLQERTLNLNYQALRHIYFDRRFHKQPEFRTLCCWIRSLPYAKQLIIIE